MVGRIRPADVPAGQMSLCNVSVSGSASLALPLGSAGLAPFLPALATTAGAFRRASRFDFKDVTSFPALGSRVALIRSAKAARRRRTAEAASHAFHLPPLKPDTIRKTREIGQQARTGKWQGHSV